eukprot:gene19203-biopygen19823
MLMGDFNVRPEDSRVLRDARMTGGWEDLALAQAEALGTGPVDTCIPNNGGEASRIDIVFGNTVALAATRTVEVIHDTGLNVHRPVRVELDMKTYAQRVRMVNKPSAFPVEDWPEWTAEACAEAAAEAVDEVRGTWQEAARERDVEKMWRLFNKAAEQYLAVRSKELPAFAGRTPRRFRGRGECRNGRRGHLAAHQRTGVEGALSVTQRRAARLRGQLMELQRQRLRQQAGKGASPEEVQQLWQALRKLGRQMMPEDPYGAMWAAGEPPTLAKCEECLAEAQRQAEALNHANRRERAKRWREWVSDCWERAQGKLYAWCKGTRQIPVHMLRREAGSYTGEVVEMDELLRKAWGGVFRKHAVPFGKIKGGQSVTVTPMGCPPGSAMHRLQATVVSVEGDKVSVRWHNLERRALAQRGCVIPENQELPREWWEGRGHAVAEPRWDQYEERFGKYITEAPMRVADLDVQRLQETLRKMKKKQAGGIEGWRVAELKALPEPLLELLAEFYNVVEREGRWPEALKRSLITLIPKGEGTEPLNLRPISVMSPVYRLWAATRLREMIRWQERWIARGQKGFRQGYACSDVYYEIALQIEEAILCGKPLGGISWDYRKCFDLIPQEILLRLLARMGLDERIGAPMRAMYVGLQRQFKVGASGAIGAPFYASNGILQGCPVSVIALNALLSVWSRAVETEATGTQTAAYADDKWQLTTADTVPEIEGVLQKGVNVTEEHAALTGQEISATKSYCFLAGVGGGYADLRVNANPIPRKDRAKGLGAELYFGRMPQGETPPVAEARILTALQTTQRIQRLPFNPEKRARMLMTSAVPVGRYGGAITPFTGKQLASLRKEILAALFPLHKGQTKPRSADIVFSLIWPGHRLDPEQVVVHECMRQYYKMGCRRVELRPRAYRIHIAQRDGRPEGVPGPMGRVAQCCEYLAWQWPEACTFRTDQGEMLRCLDISEERLMHHVRESARRRLWRAAARNRANDFWGVQDGVDRHATMAMYSQRKTSAEDRGFLRTTLVGARLWATEEFWARRAPAAEREERGACKNCSTPECAGMPHAGEVETLEHMWWQCPAWRHIRDRPRYQFLKHLKPLGWPACLRRCGVMPMRVPGLQQRAELEAATRQPMRRALPKWLFRALRSDEDPGRGLTPTEGMSATTPNEHVLAKTRRTPYMSLTADPGVALYFASARSGALAPRVVRIQTRALNQALIVDLRVPLLSAIARSFPAPPGCRASASKDRHSRSGSATYALSVAMLTGRRSLSSTATAARSSALLFVWSASSPVLSSGADRFRGWPSAHHAPMPARRNRLSWLSVLAPSVYQSTWPASHVSSCSAFPPPRGRSSFPLGGSAALAPCSSRTARAVIQVAILPSVSGGRLARQLLFERPRHGATPISIVFLMLGTRRIRRITEDTQDLHDPLHTQDTHGTLNT